MAWRAFGDWGTSRLRLYRVEAGRVAGEIEGPGIGALADTPDAVLRDALARLSPEPPEAIQLCGMVGARGGLVEVSYAESPADRHEWRAAARSMAFDGIPMRIAAGLACSNAGGQADVMRGEETQVFGALADLPDDSGLFILPGTHSKWVQVEAGRIVGFRTFMTGELFALLRSRSTLAPSADGSPEDEEEGFVEGTKRALAGTALAGALFATRTMQLRQGRSGRWAGGFLSGLLIGNELFEGGAIAGGALPRSLTLIGDSALVDRYVPGLAQCGVEARKLDGKACALRGLELLQD